MNEQALKDRLQAISKEKGIQFNECWKKPRKIPIPFVKDRSSTTIERLVALRSKNPTRSNVLRTDSTNGTDKFAFLISSRSQL